MNISVLIHNPNNPDVLIGMKVTNVDHLADILRFQIEEKGLDVRGNLTIQPEEIFPDNDDETDESS